MYFFLMGGPGQGSEGLSFLIPFVMVFFIMWLLVMRPMKKERKQREEMLKNLKKGDKVATNGGIIGKITKMKNEEIELKVDESNNTKITFLRSAIINVLEQQDDKKEE